MKKIIIALTIYAISAGCNASPILYVLTKTGWVEVAQGGQVNTNTGEISGKGTRKITSPPALNVSFGPIIEMLSIKMPPRQYYQETEDFVYTYAPTKSKKDSVLNSSRQTFTPQSSQNFTPQTGLFNGARPNVVNPQSGEVLVPVGPNYIGTRDGGLYIPAGPSGVIDANTGQFIPATH